MVELVAISEKDVASIKKLCKINLSIWKNYYSKIFEEKILKYLCNFIKVQVIKDEIEEEFNYFLIKENKKIIGFASYFVESEILYFNQIYLIKSKRNKGVGFEVFNKIKDIALDLNAKEIRSYILIDLNETQEKFIKWGFKKDILCAKCIGNDWYLIENKFIYNL